MTSTLVTRRTLLKSAAGSAALAGIGMPAVVTAQADAIRIGHLTPLTGFLGPLGEYAQMGVKLAQEELTELVEVEEDEAFILHPGEFVLGSTLERVTLPDDLVARLEGKSSLGRLGLLIHSTAGFIDPGWDGHVTLELSNVANLPITIYPGMKIGQLSFVQLSEPAERPYGSAGIGSKYQGQRGPTPSRYWQNFPRPETD